MNPRRYLKCTAGCLVCWFGFETAAGLIEHALPKDQDHTHQELFEQVPSWGRSPISVNSTGRQALVTTWDSAIPVNPHDEREDTRPYHFSEFPVMVSGEANEWAKRRVSFQFVPPAGEGPAISDLLDTDLDAVIVIHPSGKPFLG